MSKYNCDNCEYSESCGGDTICNSFFTYDNDIYDLYIEDLIESGRKEYRKAFFEYMEEFVD